MSRTSGATRSLPGQGAIATIGLVLGGAFLVGLGAQIDVPMYPVPMSLQTLAVSLVGLLCVPLLAASVLLVYLALGAAGLPFFAGGGSGIAALYGPTAGYLWGFVGMAWLTAWLVQRWGQDGFGWLFLAVYLPSLALLVPGVIWLAARTPLTLGEAVMTGTVPFLVGKVVKTTLAILGARAIWSWLGRRQG